VNFRDKIQYYLFLAQALVKHRFHNAGEQGNAFLRVLNGSPAIILLALHDRDLTPLHEAIGDEPGYFLFNLWGSRETSKAIKAVLKFEQRKNRNFPHHTYIYLCNSDKEVELFRIAGLEAVLCNHNCWVDEKMFQPDSSVDKLYDAVYDANIAPYKRHELAVGIENLALISFRHPVLFNEGYARRVRKALAQASWLNDPLSDDFIFLSNDEVVKILNQSRLGLCLSAVEGAMYASIQYLLCGLPVVSTSSKGGRDVFFEDDYALIVEDNPEAVSSGVAEMLSRGIPPEVIRQRVIEKMNQHRQTFIDLLQELFDRHDSNQQAAEVWPQIFKHKMGLEYLPLDVGVKQIKELREQY